MTITTRAKNPTPLAADPLTRIAFESTVALFQGVQLPSGIRHTHPTEANPNSTSRPPLTRRSTHQCYYLSGPGIARTGSAVVVLSVH